MFAQRSMPHNVRGAQRDLRNYCIGDPVDHGRLGLGNQLYAAVCTLDL